MAKNSPPEIGLKIKNLRLEHKLTLEQLAKSSGVSKSMLSQIERGKTNPTLATIWSLTQSLNIEIAQLLENPSTDTKDPHKLEMVKAHKIPEIQSADGKCVLRILSPTSLVSQIEWYDMTLQSGGMLDSESHGDGTGEHLTVTEGELTISLGSKKLTLSAGDTARYDTNAPHIIKNTGRSLARAFLVVITA
jgi:transcriptional regulator with XRE-family HTH domain